MSSELEELFAFHLRATGAQEPVQEMAFMPGRRWRFDFAWPDKKLAVELEGGTHVRGRHTRPVGFENDCRKYSEAALAGWKVLRFTGAMVRSGEAIEMTRRALGE